MKNTLMIIGTALFLSLAMTSRMASCDPVVIGDPNKGTTIFDVKDGKNNVKITTSGILADTKEDADENEASEKPNVKINKNNKSVLEDLEDIVVPVAFFLFLLAAIMGKRFFNSR